MRLAAFVANSGLRLCLRALEHISRYFRYEYPAFFHIVAVIAGVCVDCSEFI